MSKARDLANLGSNTSSLATDSEVTAAIAPKANTTDVNAALSAKANSSDVIAKAIVDAKGDLIAATAADTVARVAVGTDGQVLTADAASAAGVKWATAASGGMTQIATGSLNTGAGAVTTISSIPQTYKHLLLTFSNYTADGAWIMMRFNGDSGTNYIYTQSATYSATDGTTVTSQFGYQPQIRLTGPGYATSGRGAATMTIYDYAVSAKAHDISFNGGAYISPTTGCAGMGNGIYTTSSAGTITSINIYPESTSLYTHSGTYTLWGIA